MLRATLGGRPIRIWLIASSALISVPALAQQTTSGSADPQTAPAAQPATPPAASEDQAPQGLQDIIVTAQRRGENLQKVPISVTAVTAEMADAFGIKGTQDIPLAAPSVNIAQTNATASITIRGVGGNGTAIDEAANALYIDGVYQAAAPSLIFALNNIDRVEVSKGPQGTLFGRNSTGGVIQIITKTPSTKFGGDFSIGYANYNTVEAKGYLTGGLASNLATDLAVYYQSQGDGWGKDVLTGKDAYKGRSFILRSKTRWDIDSGTSATLSLTYVNSKPTSSQGGNILPGETTRSAGGVAGVGSPGFYNVAANSSYDKTLTQYQGALTIEHDMGWARVVNISSYAKNNYQFAQDGDMGPAFFIALNIRTRFKNATEELQLLSPVGSRITWSAGIYALYNSIGLFPFITSGLSQGSATGQTKTVSESRTNSYSAYGQVTAPIFENTNLTVGGRYTIDRIEENATVTNPAGVVTTFNPEATDKKPTWRVSLDHQFSPQFMGYASYNRGYKSGLFNIVSPAQQKVDPQTIDAYEVGFKSQAFNNRVRFNVSAFYYDFKNIQVRAANAVGAAVLLNAASARIKGVDADLTFQPTSDFTIQSSVSYLHARYLDFPGAPYFAVLPAGGLVQTFANAGGNASVFSPEWVGSVAANYRIRTGIGDINVNGSLYYNDGYFLDPQNRVHQSSYAQLAAAMSYAPAKGVEVRVWGRNLTNRKVVSWISSSTAGDQYYPSEPRTYGVSLRYQF